MGLRRNKKLVLIGTADGASAEDFQNYYLDVHAKKVAETQQVTQYFANKIIPPYQELMDAGWGWGGNDESGILAMDELWCEEGFDVLSLYDDPKIDVKFAYEAEQVVMRPTLAQWELGTKSPWVKRIGLIRCAGDQRPEDFWAYWEKAHAPLALRTHIGNGYYEQMHLHKALVDRDVVWNGVMVLDYWSVDAFHYGHFSRPTAPQEIKEDCAIFLDVFNTLLGEEYVMKREEGYIESMFEDFPLRPNI
ncbi:MAG: EthD domain-containing protein [Eggerthellaceae bacterium]|nr:EthD domain-containing protein [Eggerthellaceae bacterium]